MPTKSMSAKAAVATTLLTIGTAATFAQDAEVGVIHRAQVSISSGSKSKSSNQEPATPKMAPLDWDLAKYGPVILVNFEGHSHASPVTFGWGTGYAAIKVDPKKQLLKDENKGVSIPVFPRASTKKIGSMLPATFPAEVKKEVSEQLSEWISRLERNEAQDVVLVIHLTRVGSSNATPDGKCRVVDE